MNENIFSRIPEARKITSRTNPLIVSLSKLQQTKYRREQKMYLAEGVKLSREAAGMAEVRYVLVQSEDGAVEQEVLEIAAACPEHGNVLVLPESVFQKISTENAPQGIITVLAFQENIHTDWTAEAASETDGQRLLLVDSVRDPGNLGTMIRTAAAFGFERILVSGCADLYHPKTVRASMGMLFDRYITVVDDPIGTIRALAASGQTVLATALHRDSFSLFSVKEPHRVCFVIGNEGQGLSDEIIHACHGSVIIPMMEGTESLNASIAASVLLYEQFRHMQ